MKINMEGGGVLGMDVHFLGPSKIYLCPKYNTFEIKVRLSPFMGGQSSVNGETNVFKFSSSTETI